MCPYMVKSPCLVFFVPAAFSKPGVTIDSLHCLWIAPQLANIRQLACGCEEVCSHRDERMTPIPGVSRYEKIRRGVLIRIKRVQLWTRWTRAQLATQEKAPRMTRALHRPRIGMFFSEYTCRIKVNGQGLFTSLKVEASGRFNGYTTL